VRLIHAVVDAPGRGTAFASWEGMVGDRTSDPHAEISIAIDARLGRYQSLVVTVIAGLILALASVPAVTLPLR